jgi:membrane protease YdiL (CAAX protease family)
MNESPFMILLYLGVAGYVANMYWEDFQANKSGQPHPKAMPGATSASTGLYVVGVVGALLILAAETGGEIALGVSGEQSDMVWFFVFATLGAGIVEETIFRGFLVVENKGRAALIGSCVGFSLLFSLIHGHFWSNEAGEAFAWTFTTKAFFTTGILFANSLWFYALRFNPWNKNRSLFPCMLAHAASNLGVFAVKLAQGHVTF